MDDGDEDDDVDNGSSIFVVMLAGAWALLLVVTPVDSDECSSLSSSSFSRRITMASVDDFNDDNDDRKY